MYNIDITTSLCVFAISLSMCALIGYNLIELNLLLLNNNKKKNFNSLIIFEKNINVTV